MEPSVVRVVLTAIVLFDVEESPIVPALSSDAYFYSIPSECFAPQRIRTRVSLCRKSLEVETKHQVGADSLCYAWPESAV